jgi:Cu/Ag efflux protein CusF
MPLRLRFLTAALLLPLAFAACSDTSVPPPLEVYEGGRAAVIDTAESGRVLLVEHEPFDSTMTQPMVMQLRLADPREAEGIAPGDKIRFDLVLRQRYRLRNVEKLPASTRLRLSTDSTAADTTAADSAAAPSP